MVSGALITQYPSFDLSAWLSSSGRFNPLHLMGGPGSGKSRLLGRLLVWHDFVTGTPQVVVDPTGGTIKNFIDKFNRWAQDYERRFWTQYKQPLPPAWVRYIEYQRQQLMSRLVYVDMSQSGSFPLYYRLTEDESLFDVAQRFVEMIRRLDPALESASVEGFNALYKIGIYCGMILTALNLQITEAEHLLRYPQKWKTRFDEALASNPEVQPAVEFFKEYSKMKPEQRIRRSESFLIKILAFTADPKLAAMFGHSERTLNLETVITKKQTVLLDFSKVHNAERRRMLLLWVCGDIFAFVKTRGTAGRQAPLGIVIDELSQLLGYQHQGQSIMAADIEEWVSVIARNYGTWLTLAHQNFSQLDKRIQAALMQGNQLIGVIPEKEDAQQVAEHFFRYDPYLVKKETPVYMAISAGPYYDPLMVKTTAGWDTQIDHVSTHTIPTIIDHTTEEFTIEEQLQLLTQEIQDLPLLHFLVRASGREGQLAAPLRILDISPVDAGVYPDEVRVAEACRRLSKRIEVNTKQPSSGAATMDTTPYADADDLPVPAEPTRPVSVTGEDDEEENVWQ